jgi:hypothetical protein
MFKRHAVKLGLSLLMCLALPAPPSEAHLAKWGSWEVTHRNLMKLFPDADPNAWRIKRYTYSNIEVKLPRAAAGLRALSRGQAARVLHRPGRRRQLPGRRNFHRPAHQAEDPRRRHPHPRGRHRGQRRRQDQPHQGLRLPRQPRAHEGHLPHPAARQDAGKRLHDGQGRLGRCRRRARGEPARQ